MKADKISVGNFVLTGGEIPAMVLVDTISRQIPGVLGDYNSLEEVRTEAGGSSEEFYTRPEILEYPSGPKAKKYKVPPVFLSGNPKLIAEYKKNRKK